MSDSIPFQPTDEQQRALEVFCRKWQIADLSLFGSLERGDARPNSDADVLITIPPTVKQRYSMSDLFDMEDELVEIFERPVDLVLRSGLLRSRNPIRPKRILETARLLVSNA